jgi:putative two-component system response regulator
MAGVNRGNGGSGTILVVDDATPVRGMVVRFLARLGHQVDEAGSAPEALDRLSDRAYDVVFTDLQMPGGSGLDLLAEIRSRGLDSRLILVSDRADASQAASAVEHGVDRLLLKPFDLTELQMAVEKALAERGVVAKSAGQREMYEAMLRSRKTESKIWILRAAHALVTAVEAKDAYTRGHGARVSSYTLVIGDVIGGFDIQSLRLAGDLHDVGKIGVPDAVLNKPDALTDEEVAAIQRHPEIGRRILEPLIDDSLVLGVVRWHHERWDGLGYPDGIAGTDIPLAARILAVADTLDAMTSPRAYRDALSWEQAVAEISRGAGTRFDPRVVEAMGQVTERLESLYEGFRRAGDAG